MKVRDIMTRGVKACGPNTSLAAAAAIMWTSDCGALPVVDDRGSVLGMITDRDIAIALGTGDNIASEIIASDVISGKVYACAPDDDMRREKIRRLPVVNGKGVIQGILSMNDIVLHAAGANGKKNSGVTYKDAVNALKAICEHRIMVQDQNKQVATGATA